MKLKKESKIRVLENFYSLDYTLFGKPVTEVDVCCPVFVEEYMAVKGALMSLVIEMYRLVKHSPKPITEKVETKELMKNARKSAIIARENCQKLVTSTQGRKNVKQDLRESLEKTDTKVDIEKLVHEKIRTKAYSLAIDNLLIGRAITESKKYDKLNSWDGRILEDAYKILRDNLVECAKNILENMEAAPKKKPVTEGKEKVAVGMLKAAGGFKGLTKVNAMIKGVTTRLGANVAKLKTLKPKSKEYEKLASVIKLDKERLAALEKFRKYRAGGAALAGGTAVGTIAYKQGQKT